MFLKVSDIFNAFGFKKIVLHFTLKALIEWFSHSKELLLLIFNKQEHKTFLPILKFLFWINLKLSCLLSVIWLLLRFIKSFGGSLGLKILFICKECLYFSIWLGVALEMYECRSENKVKGLLLLLNNFYALEGAVCTCFVFQNKVKVRYMLYFRIVVKNPMHVEIWS